MDRLQFLSPGKRVRTDDVGSFGEHLRQAREARKITLNEIAATTKIGTRTLQALEEDHFDQLPGGIFNKGFVRSYARCVGLDEEKTLAAYMEAAKVSSPETDMQELSSQVSAARDAQRNSSGPNAATVVGVLAVIVALALGGFWLVERRKEAREQQRQAAEQVAVTSAPAMPVAPPTVVPADPNTPTGTPAATDGTAQNAAPNMPQNTVPGAQNAPQTPAQNVSQPATPASSATAKTAAGKQPVEISISATSRAWISVRSDGKTVESLTLDPEKPELRSRNYTAKEKLMLVAGNPAGLSVTYNGKSAGTLGPVGQRTTITFTPEGIEKQ